MSLQKKINIVHLILAAGSSTRMGAPKQLLPWGTTSLIGHAITRALSIENTPVFVVLGANYELIYNQISHYAITSIYNKKWSLGMGSSIRLGLQTIKRKVAGCEAVLISIIDQPVITVHHLNALITSFESGTNSIVASNLGAKIGVPAIFSKHYFDELEALHLDYGARHIIKNYSNQVGVIDAIDIGMDIDTIAQYDTLRKRFDLEM
ncbi:nucleotidyltransferase family protein [Aquimarina sp. U1-2]|uniref:nucleotidyltransferase family protein n=1 Tax=Aquimarina sp. U1-2 TaxID=2823141 RepID=UPI001AECE86F|nr:nucleotidyltransferase family protein [Aquimarina sp. U1-2]MBP2832069.1 nucleotidyltransferase family protein [Aquimarina sp. U1-2]